VEVSPLCLGAMMFISAGAALLGVLVGGFVTSLVEKSRQKSGQKVEQQRYKMRGKPY
jgi:hypothetical protein